MRRSLLGIGTVAACICASPAYGQRMAEQFIPVGQSPGISGTYSYVGEIQAVDVANQTFTVADRQGPRSIKVTTGTWIWLDRSARRLSNQVGSISDLQPGRRVEVKYVDYATKDTADWIKVVVPG